MKRTADWVKRTRVVWCVLFIAVGLCLTGLPALSAAITVTNANDSGAGSLRQAILDANAGDTIEFDASLNGQTITLTSGELFIEKDLTINGLGADQLTISGNNNSRVFYVSSGTVTISGLTISDGKSGSDDGGGIKNNSTLSMTNCNVSDNSALYAGGG